MNNQVSDADSGEPQVFFILLSLIHLLILLDGKTFLVNQQMENNVLFVQKNLQELKMFLYILWICFR